MSSKMTLDRTNFWMKSSRTVKSSKTCYLQVSAEGSYLVYGEEAPEQDAQFLVERHYRHWVRQIRQLWINHVLKVLRKAQIQRIQIDPTMQHSHQAIIFIDRHVLTNLLLALFGCSRSVVIAELAQGNVAAFEEVLQIFERWWFVLNEHKQQVQTQRDHVLTVSTRVDSRQVRNSISLTIIRKDSIEQRNEQILNILCPLAREVRRERIQNKQILIRCIVKWLREHYYHQSQQRKPVSVVLSLVVVRGFGCRYSWLPHDLIVNSWVVRQGKVLPKY